MSAVNLRAGQCVERHASKRAMMRLKAIRLVHYVSGTRDLQLLLNHDIVLMDSVQTGLPKHGPSGPRLYQHQSLSGSCEATSRSWAPLG